MTPGTYRPYRGTLNMKKIMHYNNLEKHLSMQFTIEIVALQIKYIIDKYKNALKNR